eukprot:GSA25T00012864001.1
MLSKHHDGSLMKGDTSGSSSVEHYNSSQKQEQLLELHPKNLSTSPSRGDNFPFSSSGSSSSSSSGYHNNSLDNNTKAPGDPSKGGQHASHTDQRQHHPSKGGQHASYTDEERRAKYRSILGIPDDRRKNAKT